MFSKENLHLEKFLISNSIKLNQFIFGYHEIFGTFLENINIKIYPNILPLPNKINFKNEKEFFPRLFQTILSDSESKSKNIFLNFNLIYDYIQNPSSQFKQYYFIKILEKLYENYYNLNLTLMSIENNKDLIDIYNYLIDNNYYYFIK